MHLVPRKKVVPSFVPYICAVMYIIIVLLAIFGVANIVSNKTITFVCLIVVAVIVLSLIAVNYSFSWYKSAEIHKSNNFVSYDVVNVVSVLGRDITKYHIIRCDKFDWKGKDLIVHGDIEVFEPMSKGKHVKKITINDATTEVEDLLVKYFNI